MVPAEPDGPTAPGTGSVHILEGKSTRLGYLIEPTLSLRDKTHAISHYNTVQKIIVGPALEDGGCKLYSAGRDGVICRWQSSELRGDAPSPEARACSHIDWISDMILLNSGAVITSSHDRQVLLWPADFQSSCRPTTLALHLDYAKCLAYSPLANSAFSAGLDGELYCYSLASDAQIAYNAQLARSLVCMKASPDGQLVVIGCSDGSIRGYDSRMPCAQASFAFTGHSDIVRSLILDTEAATLLSGGSDCIVRLWDLRHLGSQTLSETPKLCDSVWAMDSTGSKLAVGCKDGSVLVSDTKLSSKLETVCRFGDSSSGVTSIAFNSCGTSLWAASTGNSDLVQLDLQDNEPRRVKGAPSFVKYELLNDKRHAVVLDSDGQVSLWDILTVTMVKHFGYNTKSGATTTFAEAVERNATTEWVSPWCSLDLTLGALAVSLDERRSVDSFIYYDTVPFLPASLRDKYGEHRVSVGTWAICNIMRNSLADKFAVTTVGGAAAGDEQFAIINGFPFLSWPSSLPIWTTEDDAAADARGTCPVFRSALGEFPCTENADIPWPEWAVRLALGGGTAGDQKKVSFFLKPAAAGGSDLPNRKESTLLASMLPELTLSHSQLTTNRMLRVRKILVHILAKLQINCPQVTAQVYQQWTGLAPAESDSNGNVSLAPEDFMELVCSEQLLDPRMTLATVRYYIWKPEKESPGDLFLLQYRLKPHVRFRAAPHFPKTSFSNLSGAMSNSGTRPSNGAAEPFPPSSNESSASGSCGSIVLLDQFKVVKL